MPRIKFLGAEYDNSKAFRELNLKIVKMKILGPRIYIQELSFYLDISSVKQVSHACTLPKSFCVEQFDFEEKENIDHNHVFYSASLLLIVIELA